MGQRSTSRSISGDDETLVVAQIRGAHGIRGEVRLDPRTDVQGRFTVGSIFDCEGIGPLTITSSRGPIEQPIIAFEGYDSRPSVDALRDRFLRVPRDDARRAIAHGAVLWADLVGLAVQTPDGAALGIVRDLIRAGATDVLVIEREGGELLLPMIDSVIKDIDLAAGRITATPLDEL